MKMKYVVEKGINSFFLPSNLQLRNALDNNNDPPTSVQSFEEEVPWKLLQ